MPCQCDGQRFRQDGIQRIPCNNPDLLWLETKTYHAMPCQCCCPAPPPDGIQRILCPKFVHPDVLRDKAGAAHAVHHKLTRPT